MSVQNLGGNLVTNIWVDGTCLNCKQPVIECSVGSIGVELILDNKLADYADYQNTCTNEACQNYGWHYIGDDEEPTYYTHETAFEADDRLRKIAENCNKRALTY